MSKSRLDLRWKWLYIVCHNDRGVEWFDKLTTSLVQRLNMIAGWSNWKLVGLITRRLQVQVLPPLL